MWKKENPLQTGEVDSGGNSAGIIQLWGSDGTHCGPAVSGLKKYIYVLIDKTIVLY